MQAKKVALGMFNKTKNLGDPSNNDIPLEHFKSSHRS